MELGIIIFAVVFFGVCSLNIWHQRLRAKMSLEERQKHDEELRRETIIR